MVVQPRTCTQPVRHERPGGDSSQSDAFPSEMGLVSIASPDCQPREVVVISPVMDQREERLGPQQAVQGLGAETLRVEASPSQLARRYEQVLALSRHAPMAPWSHASHQLTDDRIGRRRIGAPSDDLCLQQGGRSFRSGRFHESVADRLSDLTPYVLEPLVPASELGRGNAKDPVGGSMSKEEPHEGRSRLSDLH